MNHRLIGIVLTSCLWTRVAWAQSDEHAHGAISADISLSAFQFHDPRIGRTSGFASYSATLWAPEHWNFTFSYIRAKSAVFAEEGGGGLISSTYFPGKAFGNWAGITGFGIGASIGTLVLTDSTTLSPVTLDLEASTESALFVKGKVGASMLGGEGDGGSTYGFIIGLEFGLRLELFNRR